MESEYFMTPNGGKYIIGSLYEYPNGEIAYQNGSIKLPNRILILHDGCIQLTKDIYAPFSLTSEPKLIKFSQHFTLQPSGVYQIHGKKNLSKYRY